MPPYGGAATVTDFCFTLCGDGLRVNTIDPVKVAQGMNEECDDNNNANGDGCSAGCVIEPGFYCFWGSPYSRDYCAEICGDAYDLLWYECDDGNTVSGDGCSSSCVIERGYNCNGGDGSGVNSDICIEICGDGA